MSEEHESARVVILGAGFAGLYAAKELARLLPHEDDGTIVLVDQHNYMLFTPMLTEVVGGQIDPRHATNAIRHLSPRVRFEQGRVEDIDLSAKTVTITVGSGQENIPEERRVLQAEHLVVALGSVTSFHGIPGVQEHSYTVKSVDDAARIRARVLELLERADAEDDPEVRRHLLTFVVGGGGFSGVETMAALNDLVRGEATNYPRIHDAEIRTIIVHPGKRLLPELSAGLAGYAQKKLQERGVEVRLNAEISGAGADYVELKGGERIPTRLLVWTAGVTPSPLVSKLDCKKGHHGGIVVDACFQVHDHPGVWALGDCAEVPQPGGKKTYAPTAQNATREGTHLAHNIVAVINGRKPQPFVYKPIGELAIVGKRAGVASVYGVHLSGILAWFMWRTVYLSKMPRLSKRIRVGLDWMLDALFGREIEELPA